MLSSRTIRLCGPDAGMGSPVKASTTARFWRTGVPIDPRHASRGLVAAQDLRETKLLDCDVQLLLEPDLAFQCGMQPAIRLAPQPPGGMGGDVSHSSNVSRIMAGWRLK